MTQSPEPVDTFHLLRAHPGDPPNIRLLRLAVIGMGVLLALGFGAVVARIAYLATRVGPATTAVATPAMPGLTSSASWPAEVRLALPPGAKVRTQSLDGSRLAVHYEGAGGDGIIILDLESGRPLSQIRIETTR